MLIPRSSPSSDVIVRGGTWTLGHLQVPQWILMGSKAEDWRPCRAVVMSKRDSDDFQCQMLMESHFFALVFWGIEA